MRYQLYETEFTTPLGGLDTNQLWARSPDEAEALCIRRNIGERLVGPAGYAIKTASDWLAEHDYGQALHAAIWMGYFACHLGVCDGYTLTCEGGVLHDLAHLVINRGDEATQAETYARAYQGLIALEDTTPGFYRPRLNASDVTGSWP